MGRIIRKFDVTLTVPILISPKISNTSQAPCKFQIEDSEVSIWLGKCTEPVYYEELADWEMPRLLELRVWVSRPASDTAVAEPSNQLTGKEEKDYERILIEAARRFVSAIKQRIEQWDLDTRHPIHSYTYQYESSDVSVGTESPLPSGSNRRPEYFLGSLSFRIYDELTGETWSQIIEDVKSPIALPAYEELLYDAETFRRSMRYDISALFAAIAVELMLEATCKALLKVRGHLSDDQCDAILSDRRIPSLISLTRHLEPSIPIVGAKINQIMKLRNKVAHGEKQTVTSDEGSQAIQIAEDLKHNLSEGGYLRWE